MNKTSLYFILYVVHTTNLVNRNGNKRSPTPFQEASPDGYKAVVVLHLSGGLDSFNVLMPYSTCPLYSSYRKARESKSENIILDHDVIFTPGPLS